MGKIHFLFCMMIFWFCSDSPNEVPLDSYRYVVFNINMNNVLNTIYSLEDSVSLIVNDFEVFEMIDEDGDNILSITISNMILGSFWTPQPPPFREEGCFFKWILGSRCRT